MDPIEPWIDAENVRRLARQLTSPSNTKTRETPMDPGFGPGFEGFIVQKPADYSGADRPQGHGATAPASPRPERTVEPAPEARPEPPPLPPTQAGSPAEGFKPEPADKPPAAPSSSAVPVVTRHADDEPKPFLIKPPQESAAAPRAAEASGERGPLVARMERFRMWLSEKVDARGMFILDRDGNPVVDDPTYGKLHFLARSLAQAYRPTDGGSGNVHVKIGSDAYLAVVPVKTDFGSLVLGAVIPKPLEASAVEAIARGLEGSLRPERR